MKDYYKIGEISKIYGIGRDSLMYYEEIGILRPVRDINGYRMYNISVSYTHSPSPRDYAAARMPSSA
ncbi:MerR family transcriptional regulator [Clostridioides difficile]|uniref:MerR family transcriptional regulator n=1 Tax=Clostridioides difficile TaxID=1496 RepID=UPI0025634AC3|nr:hypothetical protein JSCD12_36380 [Clostridioides difficile]